ncbi:MAG: sigma-54-dependent Fis family transcriptional regulator [Deltaproteobacteria bacterium]
MIDRAWQRYVLDGVEPDGIPEEIVQSWRRVRERLGIDPRLRHVKLTLSPDALEERRSRSEALALARPILDEFAERLGLTDHVLAYLDGDGWMLSIDGAPATVESVAGIDFRPGTSWREDSAGTNGPGTALAERKPVEVFASEHFVEAWQPWSCAAAPIFAAGLQEPVGLVDITGPWQVQKRQALVVARAIACAIEERLNVAASVRAEVVKHVFRASHLSGDALVAVDRNGAILALNDAASRCRTLVGRKLPAGGQDALTRALACPGTGTRDFPLAMPGGRELMASPITHDGTIIGAILRVPAERSVRRGERPSVRAPAPRYEFDRIQGTSESLRRAVDLAAIASRNTLPVVLSGESGTGKELLAQAIHAASSRRDGPFVAVNCGAIPATLAEAELFGYEPGAFTGGRREGSPGRFEDADGGTLFLDEVVELCPSAQTALLRVLQESEVVRLGGSSPRRTDVRVVVATNKPLDGEIAAGRFRRDLYYRLNVLSIAVPPLRERGDDVVLLARAFLEEAEAQVGRSGLSFAAEAIDSLRAHTWPGNVRELKNVILRAAATAPFEQLRREDLLIDVPVVPVRAPDAVRPERPKPVRESLLQSAREALIAALDACDWNIARAAAELGISRMTLYRRLVKYGVTRLDRLS